MLSLEQIQSLDRAGLNRMTSDEYRAEAEGSNAASFKARVDAIENAPRTATTPTRAHGSVRGEDAPASNPAQTFANDPSWSDVDEQPAPAAAAPAAAQPAAPATLAEWRYWPTDSQGRHIGGEQVFRHDPSLPNEHPQSLASQLTKAHSHATRALKEKKTREFIDSVKSEDDGYVEPRLLTVLDHPEAEALNQLTATAMDNAVQSALSLFKQRHSEFILGDDNAAAMVSWVIKSKRNPASGATWEAAWESLKPYLLPNEATSVAAVPAPAPAPVVEQPKPAAPATRPANANRIGTGLSSADSFNPEVEAAPTKVAGVRLVMPNGQTKVMTLADWNKQSSEFQKRVLRNGSNAAQINALYDAEDQKRAAARSGR